jgi:hypothetical protein
MTKNIIILILVVNAILVTSNATSANPSLNTASAYKQSLSHSAIKLRPIAKHKKTAKVKDTNPLPPIHRPSIKAKQFQQKQYQKATNRAQKKRSPRTNAPTENLS